jgi:copper chaperone CopZ
MSTAVLKIDGMTCNHCVAAVERALRGQEGVNSAIVHLQQGTAEVDFEAGAIAPEELVAAVEEEGYTALISG